MWPFITTAVLIVASLGAGAAIAWVFVSRTNVDDTEPRRIAEIVRRLLPQPPRYWRDVRKE